MTIDNKILDVLTIFNNLQNTGIESRQLLLLSAFGLLLTGGRCNSVYMNGLEELSIRALSMTNHCSIIPLFYYSMVEAETQT
jgi:hypothetical protein